MEKDYELTLRDYLAILHRRILLIATVFLVIFSIAIVFSIVRPPVYQSSATILIESQQISPQIIASTVPGYATERVEIIRQRVMTRENLLGIVKKYDLFKSYGSDITPSRLVDLMRGSIALELLSIGRGRSSNVAFSIAFENRYPELAYRVTNELVTLFLDENARSRVQRATETTEFLAQEAMRLKEDLEKIESQVAAYKQENANALPEHLNLKMQMLDRTQSTLSALDTDYKAKEVELSRLEIQLEAEKSGDIEGSTLNELENLKAEYKKAKLLYKDNHPTVRLLKHKIDALNKSAENESNDDKESAGVYNTVLVSKIKSMIDSVKSELTSIEEQRISLRKRASNLEEEIIKTPQIELGLSSLMRDHGNAKAKYEEMQEKLLTAKVAENLEGENKSERLTLLDPPLLPDKPIKPNRKKILMIGLLLAIAAPGGLVFLLEMLNPKIRSHGELTSLLGQSPLVELPYIKTVDEGLHRKKLIKKVAATAAVFFIISLIIVHFAYMELDLLFFKILARFG